MKRLPYSLVDSIDYWECGIRDAEHDPQDTLNVALTHEELALVGYGIAWLGTLYGTKAVVELRDKFRDLVDAQEFCKCERCTERREFLGGA